ncbi:putative E3 ubiquitin-protein ligase MYCBP2 [Paratrimastix pyriformis]|uniref:E3 ubiquitin-protein ligase MYCBP2 n=1 Tax=Paratrimastix pyriformis TaxID=342808 RepID=A0ABQ8UIS5_9EUKA|nr:putative E3 ubiquitin-protein ligase MYCBP2 [Paratrimastix pyriformis]
MEPEEPKFPDAGEFLQSTRRQLPVPFISAAESLSDEQLARMLEQEEMTRLAERRQSQLEEEERLTREFLAHEEAAASTPVPVETEPGIECVSCHQPKSFEDVYYLETCTHPCCLVCLRDAIQRAVDAKRCASLTCPACPKPLVDEDIRHALPEPDQYERYAAAALAESPDGLPARPGLMGVLRWAAHAGRGSVGAGSRAYCHVPQLEVRIHPAVTALTATALTATALTATALTATTSRICETVFCGKCGLAPYHLGRTCEDVSADRHCRYCQEALQGPPPSRVEPAFRNVCHREECQVMIRQSCPRMLPCGHPCCGFRSASRWPLLFGTAPRREAVCLPCLDPACAQAAHLAQGGPEFCNICFIDQLGAAPCIQLRCGHIFHLRCVREKIAKRWTGYRITFGFLECPLCKQPFEHPALAGDLAPVLELRQKVQVHMARLPPFRWAFCSVPAFAMHKMAFFLCSRCHKPYFSGAAQCQEAVDFNPDELVCAGCSAPAAGGEASCPSHGTDFIQYKCRYCCSVACWFCWGTHHFCDPCHRKAGTLRNLKSVPNVCTCGKSHPSHGTEYCLGCSMCRAQREEHAGF